MNLLTIRREDYRYYCDLRIHECYNSRQHIRDVMNKFPEHMDDYILHEKSGKRKSYHVYPSLFDDMPIDITPIIDDVIENINVEPTYENLIQLTLLDFERITSTNNLDSTTIQRLLIDGSAIGYNKHNADIMLSILGDKQSVVDNILFPSPIILEHWNEGYKLPNCIIYKECHRDIVNDNIQCLEQSKLINLCINGYIRDTSIISGMRLDINISNDHDIMVLLSIQDTSKYNITLIGNNIHRSDILNRLNVNSMRLMPSYPYNIVTMIKYMELDNLMHLEDIIEIGPSLGYDIVSTAKIYPLGAKRLWEKYHNINATVVHAYTTYLPHIVRTCIGCVIPHKFSILMNINKYNISQSYTDIHIKCHDIIL